MTLTSPEIAHITSCYPPHLGGVEVVAQSLAAEQSIQGSRVVVLTTTAGAPTAPRRGWEGRVRVRRFRALTLAHTPLAPGLLVGLLRLPRTTLRHVHVAHAFTTEMVWLTSKLRGAKFVAHFHLDVAPSGPMGRLLAPYKKYFLGPALRAADRVVALNDEMAQFLSVAYDINREAISVVRNGVGHEFLEMGEERRVAPVGDRPLRLLFAGRIAPQKNLPRLLRALALLQSPVELTVVGDGEDRAAAEKLAAELNLANVKFVGAQYGTAYRHFLGQADVFVLPSDCEGMPVAVLEAMAAGLPVLATRVPGSTELLERVGLLVDPTPEGMAEGIGFLTGSTDRLAGLSAHGVAKARSHSWSEVVADLALTYPQVSRAT